jgi:hypothetical protein
MTFTPTRACPPEGEPKFSQRQEVVTTDALKVRENPGLSSPEIKTQPKGTSGKILEGPVCADNYVWWKVKYQDGTTGWSAQDWLEILVITPTFTPAPLLTLTLTPTPTPISMPTITPTSTITPTPVTSFGECNDQVRQNLTQWLQENGCGIPNIDRAFCAFWLSTFSYSLDDCDSIDEQIWVIGKYWGGGYGSIFHSPDSSQSWELQWSSGVWGPDPFAVDFITENEGWVATDDNILQTSDGGKTWQEIFRVKSYPGLKYWGVWLREFQVIDRLHLWGRLSEGIVVKTEDGGKTWFCSKDDGNTWQPY